MISTLKSDLAEETEKSINVKSFLNNVQKHTHISELNAAILSEFIEKIIIHEHVKDNGKKTQQIDIAYNFIGLFRTPEKEKITGCINSVIPQKHPY